MPRKRAGFGMRQGGVVQKAGLGNRRVHGALNIAAVRCETARRLMDKWQRAIHQVEHEVGRGFVAGGKDGQ